MEKLRVGVIGIGIMGSGYAKALEKGEIQGAELTAVSARSSERQKWAKENLSEKVKVFDNVDALISSGTVDAVIIATPHFSHPEIAIKSFEHGLHVLSEKPTGVYTKHVREMNEAAEKSGKVFGVLYNHRLNPVYQKMRDLIQSGELGEIKRTNWIMTAQYRPQSYFGLGEWHGSWAEEGGGVLLTQSLHQIDIWQWICGMPKRIKAFMVFGKYHKIEVEDDVTAYVEYENGSTGSFITTTGEAPGTNRFEVAGDMGKIVIEHDTLTFWRLRTSERQFNSEFTGRSGEPECWKIEFPVKGKAGNRLDIIRDWANAVIKGTPMLSPGLEGMNALQICNAMHLSAWTGDFVELPIDDELYYKLLQQKMNNSGPDRK